MSLNILSLFAGIGGLDLGLERAGMTVAGQVEIDPFCRRVLARHWPEVPRHDDVRTCVEWWRREPRPAVHVVAGGFPCQPVSTAGRRHAQKDPRWLWPPMAAVVAALRPTWVVIENVPGLLKRGISYVLSDLAGCGYRFRVGTLSACSVGAPHPRSRVFIVAHAKSLGCESWRGRPGAPECGEVGTTPVDVGRIDAERPSWWSDEPDVDRVAYGVPGGVERRRSLGNAVVPQVAEHIGRLIAAADRGAVAA